MALVRRRGIIQSEKFARKRRKKMIFAVVLFFVAIASVLTALFFFFRADFVEIKSVEVTGPVGVNGGMLSIVPAQAVQAEVEKDLDDSWLYLFSKNNLFFYPKSAITAQLSQDFPAIASVDFQSENSFLGFGRNIILHILITERSPFAVTCTNISAQTCFYIDQSGFIYAPAPQFSPGIYVRYGLLPSAVSLFPVAAPTASTSSSSAPLSPASAPTIVSVPSPTLPKIVPGEPLVDSATFSLAKQIVGAVSAMNLNVISDDIGADAYGPENQLTIDDGAIPADAISDSDDATSTQTASSTPPILTTTIYFNQSEPIDTELRYLSEFWQGEATSTAVKFQYVDLRYGKDIVFKVYPTDPKPDDKPDDKPSAKK